jgi:hypothetical protein
MTRLQNILVLALAVSAASCATTCDCRLAPPESSTREQRYAVIRECRRQALYEAPRSETIRLTAEDRDLMQGKRTGRFVTGGLVGVSRDEVPIENLSLLRSSEPTEFSNRYVLCLLKSGFRWEPAQK